MQSLRPRLRSWTALAAIVGSLALGGCRFNNAIHYTPDPTAFEICRAETGEEAPETIVGVALSGGGSRAAVFAAAGLEAMWEHGLLADLSHVSSVSGGSIAGSYFVTGLPDCGPAPQEEQDACWRDFFDEYQAAMRFNFDGAMKKRQFVKFRGLSSSRYAISMMDVLDRQFLDGRTFDDLRERPVLLVNGSSYDEGRRFVFTNLCLPYREDGPTEAERWPANRFDPSSAEGLRAATFSRPGCDRAVPGELPLSLAVASSAAFPGLMGPMTFEVPAGCSEDEAGGATEYLHVGDGGLFENSGLDTLEEVVLRERASGEGRLRRVLLLTLDSSLFEPRDKLTKIDDFWLAYHPGRVMVIAQRRGREYHDMVWDRVAGQMREEGIAFEVMPMHYTDADLDRWPASCGETGEPGTEQTRRRIRDRLESLAPALNIDDCAADLLQMAGHAVVHAAFDPQRVEQLRQQGFEIHDAAD